MDKAQPIGTSAPTVRGLGKVSREKYSFFLHRVGVKSESGSESRSNKEGFREGFKNFFLQTNLISANYGVS